MFASEAADVAALLKQMQERLTRLEQRNAELEQRLTQSPAPAADGAKLAARVDDDGASPGLRLSYISVGSSDKAELIPLSSRSARPF